MINEHYIYRHVITFESTDIALQQT